MQEWSQAKEDKSDVEWYNNDLDNKSKKNDEHTAIPTSVAASYLLVL